MVRALSAGVVALGVAAAAVTSGCSTAGYYAQSVRGHLDLVARAKPVSEWLADPGLDARLRERLLLSQRIRDFATAELKQPDNASYRRYADLQRPAAVWNVIAAPEFSLELKNWCFLVVGCIGYRGYYERAAADAFAAEVAAEGLEVSVYPVPAYSTLGALPFARLADPLLNTFIYYSEGELAKLIFHELAHQIVYAAGDTEFNESFATAVERLGGERWLQAHAGAEARESFSRQESRRNDFRALTAKYRRSLEDLYASSRSEADKRIAKADLYAAFRAEHARLKRDRWGGFDGYDPWVARANNASFGVLAAYTDLVPAFIVLFEREGGDFGRFYEAVGRLAKLDKAARRAALGVSTGSGPKP